jgi:hypothetical protein
MSGAQGLSGLQVSLAVCTSLANMLWRALQT